MEESKSKLALKMTGVSKMFPGTLAVNKVDFEAYTGEVHALIGENGAGKSTLMKMIAGSYDDYTGEIEINGNQVKLHTPSIAKENGIEMIYQELSLALPLTIAENVLVGILPVKGLFIDKKAMRTMTMERLKRVNLEYLNPSIKVNEISQHEAQLVEIAKALGNNPGILVMDEPTSALSRAEVDRLFEIIGQLKKQGLAIIYISHHLPEIFAVADKVTVMRDGKKVGTFPIGEVTSDKLVEMMVGKNVSEFYEKRKATIGEELFRAENLSRYGFFRDVSFNVRKGEILGICGLAGSGRSELARVIAGVDQLDEGEIFIEGVKVKYKSMSNALKHGIAYLTENRKTQGLALRISMGENVLSALIPRHTKYFIYSKNRGKNVLESKIKELQIYPADPARMVNNLSGGNQQKVLMAKWLATEPKIFIIDEPTRGVDIGAKQIIHQAVERLADLGNAVILISSDLPELVGLSNRIMVMRRGYFIGEMQDGEFNEESALLAANGEGKCVVCK
ncbi:MAG: sugar ABC transporter ATP-binding protein [Saccharofermentanales bacterium]